MLTCSDFVNEGSYSAEPKLPRATASNRTISQREYKLGRLKAIANVSR